MTSQEERAREVLAKICDERAGVQIHPVEYIAKRIAGTYGYQPCMSGDVRDRLNSRQKRTVQDLAEELYAAMLALAAEVREDAAEVADNTAHEARKLQARYTRDHPQWWANENIASAAEDIAAAIRAQV